MKQKNKLKKILAQINKKGKLLHYFESGKLFIEENYKNGKLHGDFKRWFENGNLAIEAQYANGKSHGELTEYYENGNKKEEGNYIDGKYFVKNFWDENGEQTLINGNGNKIESYGDWTVYRKFFENSICVKEEKIKSFRFISTGSSSEK